MLYCVCAVLALTNVVAGLALYLAPEINALFKEDNSSLVAAYEQRIVQLRLEVDRLHSRQYAQMGDLNLQMHELVQQQDVLFEQHEYVRALAEMAREMGIDMASQEQPSDTSRVTGSLATMPAETSSPQDLAASLIEMQEETRLALVTLSDAASLSTREIVSGLETVGLAPDFTDDAIGGPFMPPRNYGENSIIDEANSVAQALSQFQSARQALNTAPIRRPVSSSIPVSSNFGNRTDPFLKRTAFHAGIDFRAPTGTAIRAAAAGTVIFAGANGGYGKMVDIDHGNGLVTRYAHLNIIGVSNGQAVVPGQQIGQSGSTGRSTGPHLHFEVRRNDSAIDPNRFLTAGRTLASFL